MGEGGEIQRGTFTESSERYAIATFAKIFALSRQAIINDDLQAFANALGLMARAAAEQEAQSLADLLNANGGLGPKMANGKTLFHATHNNLAAAGAVLSMTTLSDGRQAMRNQKDLNGTTYINAVPKTLLVGPAQETLAEQVLTAIDASKTADVNPFPGKLTPAVDPRLTGNGWRLFADPAQAAVLEYAYLNGSKGPQLEQRQGWDVLGTEFRVVNDFGCAAVDTRGGWHNQGSN
ncbi:phage major capsid protein [Sphingomonas panni]